MTEPTPTPLIDLTHETELTWLSHHGKDERSLTPDATDVATLDEVLVSRIHSLVTVALARRNIGAYFDEEELGDIVDELLGAVGLSADHPDLLEWLPSSEQVVSYDGFREQATIVAFHQLQWEIEGVETLLGIPPEEELAYHSRLIGEDTLGRMSSLDEVNETEVKQAVSSDIESFGRKVIEKSLGPDSWATIVKEEIDRAVAQRPKAPADARRVRTETVAEEIDERITERVLVEAVFEVLDTPVRLSHLWELRQLILTAWRREELSDHDAKALLSKYIGYGQLPSQTAGAQTSAREEPKDEPREPVDIDDIILNTTPRESEQIRLFFFPATSPTRHEQLQKLVLSGISMKIIREHVDKPLPVEGVDRVVVWTLAARGPPYIAASKMRPGDVALFYGESGEYTHKAKIVGRIANRELANAITGVDGTFKDTNGDFRVDRPIVVFFEDVTRVSVPSKTLHAALGYNRPYPTWSTVNQQRVSSLTGPERGLEDVLSQFDRRSEEE